MVRSYWMDRLGEWLDEGSVSGAVNDVGFIGGTRSWKILRSLLSGVQV